MLTELPKSKDIMENPIGFPTSFELPIIKDLTKYKNTLRMVRDKPLHRIDNLCFRMAYTIQNGQGSIN